MRKLKTPDVFDAMRMIKKAEIKEELKPFLKQASQEGLDIEDIGIEGILTLIEILSEKKTEKVLYEFLAGPLEMTAEEVEKLDLDVMAQKLKQLAEENNLTVFFKAVSGMISKQ